MDLSTIVDLGALSVAVVAATEAIKVAARNVFANASVRAKRALALVVAEALAFAGAATEVLGTGLGSIEDTLGVAIGGLIAAVSGMKLFEFLQTRSVSHTIN